MVDVGDSFWEHSLSNLHSEMILVEIVMEFTRTYVNRDAIVGDGGL